eukprot:4583378-Prymnesium_polylepis.1
MPEVLHLAGEPIEARLDAAADRELGVGGAAHVVTHVGAERGVRVARHPLGVGVEGEVSTVELVDRDDVAWPVA